MPPCRVLITAGPTHEPIDEVRYLANRSSGRMGIAIAEAAADRGWPTTLLLGPTHLLPPNPAINVRRFRTSSELGCLLEDLWPAFDLLIMAAAVADYRPRLSSDAKIARGNQPLLLELEPTEDLLAAAARNARPAQRLVGFALEPEHGLIKSAQAKLKRKQLHAIVANPLETMDSENATAHLILRGGETLYAPPDIPKADIASWLLDALATHVLVGESCTDPD